MNSAATEWCARVAERNRVEAEAEHSWVKRCRKSRAAGALALCAVALVSDPAFAADIAEMGDGSYRFATPAMTRVYGSVSRDVVRRPPLHLLARRRHPHGDRDFLTDNQ